MWDASAPGMAMEQPDKVDQLAEGQLEHSAASILAADHLVASKRNNILLAKENTVVTSAGNSVIFYDIVTGVKKYVLGRDGGGIGAIAVHPLEPFIAVAEQCKLRAPNVYMYRLSQTSELQLELVLKAGTEHSYSAVAFNKEGNLLATVGGAPDYMLTLWDWQKESVILRHKAFSQEVYNASFSPFFDGKLITSGTGHIRMWKMAATFTGLKLVGLLGKFGQVELSDVCAYLEFSDGKVLSGTESGQLLLWAGNLIKAVFMRKGHKTCHDGNVDVLALHQGGWLVVSAGQDGYIRTWDASKINEVEPEDGYEVEIEMITEVLVPGGARIKSIVDAGEYWMLQDESGSLIHVTVPEISLECMEFTKLWSFHSGGISRAVLDRESHCSVSVDTSGSIWAYDLQSREALAKRKFPQGITCLVRAHQSIDSNQSVFFLGHENGFVRQVVRCSDGWRLAACFRAHKSEVLAVCSSPSGGEVVTCGTDRTLFFFTVNDGNLEPLAFAVLPHSPTAVVWTSEGVIVGCEDGTLLCVTPPQTHDHEAIATYEFKPEIAQQEFVLPQSLWPPPPKKKADEGEEGEGKVDEAEKGEEGRDADNWVPSAAEIGPFPIVALFQHPTNPARFLLSASGNASHHLFDISSISEEPLIHLGMSAAITSAQHSHTGVHFVTGSCDGAVRVTPVKPFTFPRRGDVFWESQVHDMQHRVTSACVTFDGTAVVSAASDGAMFSHKLEHEGLVPGQPQEGLENDRFCMLEECIIAESEDIADNSAYTIEQAKQQLEKDLLMAAAEAKKTTLRQAVAQIKKEFEQLLAENTAKPHGEQLPLSYFDIDPGMRAMIEEEVRQEEEQVRAEMQHELEKNSILLAKAKAKFLDPLEVERVELHALGQRAMVTSFRTAKLEEWVEQELQSMIKEKENAAAATEDAELAHDQEPSAGMWATHNTIDEKTSTKQGGKNKQISKHELRQQARAKRKAEWEVFLSTKPDDNYVNPVDAEAIVDATRNMGDYKLKSEKSYVPDENKRMTPKRKKQQIALLLQGIFTVKMDYNERFLALRDVKQAVCAELQHKYNELVKLNTQLGINDVVQPPCMRPSEEPERREEVTDEDIKAFISAQEAAAESAAANNLDGFAGGGGGGGSGGAGGDKGATGDAQGKPQAQGADSKAPDKGGKTKDTPRKAAGETVEALVARLSAQYPPTPMEKTQRALMERKWGVERDLLLARIEEMTTRFDEALMKLRREKIDLEMNLKAAEVQLLVLVQEHGLLVEFSARDDALAGKLAEKQTEQREIFSKISSCQLQLKDHRNHLENVAKRKAEIAAYFDSVVNENHPHRDPLLVIFNRKVKRAKKNVTNDGDDDDDEDADSDGEDDSDDDEQQEVCPAGCDQALYDEVCVIREQRLDQEDIITDISKSCEQAKKEQETLKQKLKRIEQSLAATETDIREFQQEKQASLNEIEVMVMLYAHQIEYLVDGRLPMDLNGAVVFSNKELARLRKRIDELAAEKLQMRKTQKELRKQHQQLTKDKSAKEKVLTDLEARAHDVQMLKFGREIDLDLLEQMGPTPGADDLRAQLREQEKRFVAELREWDQKLGMRTEELVALTQENTIHLNTVGELTSQQKALESGIRRTRKDLLSDPVAAQKRESAERDHLIDVIQSQAKEIDYIRSQIDVLKRKDTSVFQ